MLAVPLKTSKELGWDKPLYEYIKANFGGEAVAVEYAQDLQRLNNSRKRAVQAVFPDEASVEAQKKYLNMLQTVSFRFPSLKGGEGKAEWRGLGFSWTDSFRPKSVVAQTDVEFEKACILFNLGALESLAGIQHDLKTVENLKVACANFTRAAGIFACLERGMVSDESSVPSRLSGNLTSDLSPEGLGLLKNLMLAQAQFCCFERALMDEMKPGVLAKVAAQVAKFYDQSLTFAKNPNLAKVLDQGWANHIEFHKRKNESWCAFYNAQAVFEKAQKTGEGYGDQVAWLTKAETTCRSAWQWASSKGLPGGLILPIKNLLDKIQSDLTTAREDNSKIYFQQVPDPNSLPNVEGHILAKATPVEERLLKPTSDDPIFKNLLTPWIRQAEEAFQSKLAAQVKLFGERVTTRTNEIRQGLADAGLPASVEGGTGGESGLPGALWDRISNQVLSRGGLTRLNSDASENARSNEFLAGRLRDLEKDLNAERDADGELRTRFGSSFKAQPSRQLNSGMLNDLSQYKSLLVQAKKSDEAVPVHLQQHAAYLNLLGKSREELASYLPNVKEAIINDPQVEKVRQDLMVLLVDLGVKVQECETAQTQFVEAVTGATIVEELEATDKMKANEVVANAMSNFQPYTQEVESKLSSISAKFSVVLEKNHSFAALRTQNEATRKREKALAALDTAIQKYAELSGLIQEGARFYTDISGQIEQLSVVIQDFCFVRNVERDEFVQSQGNRSHAPSFADTPTAPVLVAPAPPPSYSSTANAASYMPPRQMSQPQASAPQQPGLYRMKSALGLHDIPDDVLEPYLKAANGDINAAINKYFESPPAENTQPRSVQPASTGMTKKKGGWFQ